MSVVQLNGNFVREGIEVRTMMLPGSELTRLVTTNDVLKCCRAHEVLLLQTQFLALEEVVVWIQYS